MRYVITALLCFLSGLSTIAAENPLCEPWNTEYAGDDVSGQHVIGLWQFNADAPIDQSKYNHETSLRGASIASDGRFGRCLESSPGWPIEDKPYSAMVKNSPTLSPAGAFTLEMWISPKEALNADYPDSFLLDKKYVAHDDYQLILGSANRYGFRSLRACLGFGDDSSTYNSRPLKLETGTWYHIAFTYDGRGSGRFFFNGMPWGGSTHPSRRSISPGRHALSIGDRIGSYYHGFPGFIDQVRISNGAREFRQLRLELLSQRRVFVRMEAEQPMLFSLTNLQRDVVPAASVSIALDGVSGKALAAGSAVVPEARVSIALDGQGERTLTAGPIPPGESRQLQYTLDTSLRPDQYTISAHVQADLPNAYSADEQFPIQIVARQLPGRFPVLMWGLYGNVTDQIPTLKRIGFNHVLGVRADFGRIWASDAPTDAADAETVQQTRRELDAALANDLTLVSSLSPGAWLRSREEYRRIGRDGKLITSREDICGLFSELPPFCFRVGASVAGTYGNHPAFGAALLHTEVRDHANPCFHEHDAEAFREATGLEIPSEVSGNRGVDYQRLADFPEDRVIPDDHPLYRYYRWYWKQGDGWNALNQSLHDGLKSKSRQDFWTFHDPAVRVASVYGSGGGADVLSQWTYSYPDPIRIGLATDELLAMAAGADHPQQVMKMTQIIWYRGQTAPEAKKPEDRLTYQAAWERQQPDAPFITIAPMHLREAFWAKLARPIRGIMYHGWQSLVPTDSTSGYRYTNPQTQHELSRLIHEVIHPLGPTLLEVPGVAGDAAFLKSFASEMFARRGTYGWGGGWSGDCYHVLRYAHLQPQIVFDETIIDGGLDGMRVLVMPDCDVLTQTVADRIKAFQAGGGIVVGDERTCPAIQPDILVVPYKRTGRADHDKRQLQQLAATLREQLDDRYQRTVDSSNADVIPYLRRWNTTDYVFTINDHREFGQYVGHHGIVMENGLPSAAEISLRRERGHVYDLLNHCEVDSRTDDGQLRFSVALGPCDGNVFMVTDEPITELDLSVSEQTTANGQVACRLRIIDPQQKPVAAAIPVELIIRDPESREAERSGFYSAVGGELDVQLDIASNDRFGTWTVMARELASGRSATAYFQVLSPDPWPPNSSEKSGEITNPEQPQG